MPFQDITSANAAMDYTNASIGEDETDAQHKALNAAREKHEAYKARRVLEAQQRAEKERVEADEAERQRKEAAEKAERQRQEAEEAARILKESGDEAERQR